jgi:hypothetical protein
MSKELDGATAPGVYYPLILKEIGTFGPICRLRVRKKVEVRAEAERILENVVRLK